MTTSTEVATIQPPVGALALRGDQVDWNDTQRAALAQIGIDEAPRGDQLVFLHVAQRSQLDPFAQQIYLVGRWDAASKKKKWTIQTGIQGFRVIANRREEYAGQTKPEWCGPDGQWTDVWLPDEPPVAARVGIKRRDQDEPNWGVVKFAEFAGKKGDGTLNSMWLTKGSYMISKCAEAAGFRRAFPQDFAGLYIHEEMEHLANPVPAPMVVIQAERVDSPQSSEPDWDALIAEHEAARDVAALWDLRKLAQGMRPNDGPLLNRIAEAWTRTKKAAASSPEPAPAPAVTTPDPAPARPPAGATQKANPGQLRELAKLLAGAGVKTTDARLRAVAHILERDELTGLDELSGGDVTRAITRLEAIKNQPPEQPAEQTPADTTEGEQP